MTVHHRFPLRIWLPPWSYAVYCLCGWTSAWHTDYRAPDDEYTEHTE